MRIRRALGAGLVALVLGPFVAYAASAQVVPNLPPIPEAPVITAPPPPAGAAPVLHAAAPAGVAACGGLYTALSTVALVSVLVPGLPVALPVVPTVGLYTVVGAAEGAVRPPLDGICLYFL